MGRYIDAVPQYLDGAGNPLVNGKLTFYKAGTTSLLKTYADAESTILNTNPVKLDAAGRTPDIYFDGAARVVLTSDNIETCEYGKQWFDRSPVFSTSGDDGEDPALSLTISYVFNTVADMTSSTILFPVGKLLETNGYYDAGGGGAAKYLVKTEAEALADGDVLDGYGNLQLDNGNWAILQDDTHNILKYGALVGVSSNDALRACLDGSNKTAYLPETTGAYIFDAFPLTTGDTIETEYGTEIKPTLSSGNIFETSGSLGNIRLNNMFFKDCNIIWNHTGASAIFSSFITNFQADNFTQGFVASAIVETVWDRFRMTNFTDGFVFTDAGGGININTLRNGFMSLFSNIGFHIAQVVDTGNMNNNRLEDVRFEDVPAGKYAIKVDGPTKGLFYRGYIEAMGGVGYDIELGPNSVFNVIEDTFFGDAILAREFKVNCTGSCHIEARRNQFSLAHDDVFADTNKVFNFNPISSMKTKLEDNRINVGPAPAEIDRHDYYDLLTNNPVNGERIHWRKGISGGVKTTSPLTRAFPQGEYVAETLTVNTTLEARGVGTIEMLNSTGGTIIISDLTNGVKGQIVTLFNNGPASTQISHNANFNLEGATAFVMGDNAALTLLKTGGFWVETGRKV